MEIEFVDRAQELADLCRSVRIRSTKPRVVAVDSPAGMGKTRLLVEACRRLIEDASRLSEEWQIARLDFRTDFRHSSAQGRMPYQDKSAILQEIARQMCRDIQWKSISNQIRLADAEDVILIRQAARIPMEDYDRQVLLQHAASILPAIRNGINDIIKNAFNQAAVPAGHPLESVEDLVRFILEHCHPPESRSIPQRVLIVLDSVDAIASDDMRHWIVNELALTLATRHDLQCTFLRLAVILSGRFLLEEIDPPRKRSDYQEMVLRSFANKTTHVEDLIRQFGDTAFNSQAELVNRLARKLCQVCGGHPKVIKETAEGLYAGPGHFTVLVMVPHDQGYWYDQPPFLRALRERREMALRQILNGVEEQDRRLLELLSIFRFFNHGTLEFLGCKIRESGICNYSGCIEGDVRTLYEGLKSTRLIGNDGALNIFDSDRFSLSLVSAHLHDLDRGLFRLLNQWAVELYTRWSQGMFWKDTAVPPQPVPGHQRLCVREWLYHRLCLAECCRDFDEAAMLGQKIADQLAALLKAVVPYPYQTATEQRFMIRRDVEDDEQIGHLIWEAALEDRGRREVIRNRILQAFEDREEEQ